MWDGITLNEFFTPAPYSHLLSMSSEFKLSPFESFLNTLAILPPPSLGTFQVVIQPVNRGHNWHRSVQMLKDLEYLGKLYGGQQLQQRLAQQAPSGQLNNMANDVETKSDPNKPFFCATVRVALLGGTGAYSQTVQRALTTFLGVFLHGGKALESVSQEDYREKLSVTQIRDMFRLGVTHRAGSLLNSAECCGFLHLPPIASLTQRGIDVSVLKTFFVRGDIFSEGTYIGDNEHIGESRKVSIPDGIGASHIHMLGKPGSGKSFAMEHMCCDDIKRGHGVAVIDPHGDLAEGILSRLREEDLDRVIYFDAGDDKFIPVWNALARSPGQRADRTADDFLRALKTFTTGWGDRLETLLRQALYGLVHTGEATLQDVANLLTTQSTQREKICKKILAVVENIKARNFWENEIHTYKVNDFAPAQHKLTRLLLHDSLGPMFSQPGSNFQFQEIMDDGMIFIANLSTIGSEIRDVMGSLLMSMFHLASLGRSTTPPPERRFFRIYADEVHRFVTDALEDLLTESRKYNCSLVLAHQHLSQLETRKRIDALGIVGTTMVLNVSADDAPRMAKNIGGGVTADDLTSLDTREAIVRIKNDVIKIETPFLEEVTDSTISKRVKELSRERYYKPIAEVWELVRQRDKPSSKHLVSKKRRSAVRNPSQEFHYEEFPAPQKNESAT
jgi:hypothetical protein